MDILLSFFFLLISSIVGISLCLFLGMKSYLKIAIIVMLLFIPMELYNEFIYSNDKVNTIIKQPNPQPNSQPNEINKHDIMFGVGSSQPPAGGQPKLFGVQPVASAPTGGLFGGPAFGSGGSQGPSQIPYQIDGNEVELKHNFSDSVSAITLKQISG